MLCFQKKLPLNPQQLPGNGAKIACSLPSAEDHSNIFLGVPRSNRFDLGTPRNILLRSPALGSEQAVHNQAPMLSQLYIGHNQALLMMWAQLYLHSPLITNPIQDQKDRGREVQSPLRPWMHLGMQQGIWQQWDLLEDSKLKVDLFLLYVDNQSW